MEWKTFKEIVKDARDRFSKYQGYHSNIHINQYLVLNYKGKDGNYYCIELCPIAIDLVTGKYNSSEPYVRNLYNGELLLLPNLKDIISVIDEE